MKKDFCVGCKGIKYPNCAIFEIINTVTLKDILESNTIKKNQYLVCHKNAQKIESGNMIIQPKCDECMLCQIACNRVGVSEFDISKIEKSIFNDLGKLNIFATSLNANSIVASEVKTDGNYRQKRIDLVVKKENSVVFIKSLQNIDKYNFYYRSYEEIVEGYREQYPGMKFSCKTLIPSNKKERAVQLGYKVILADDIVNIL